MATMKSFESLLLALSEDLTSSDLEKLKFLYSKDIPAGPLEKVAQGFQLFTVLKHNNLLSEENREPLSMKLINIHRKDLSNKLLGIQGPVEQFPTLNELRPALPDVRPPTVIPPGGQLPPAATNGSYSSTSSTRVPLPAKPADTFSRQPPPRQATGTSSTGLDISDHGPERVITTIVQVDSSLRQHLSSDGRFLDPTKYDPIKKLGFGGFAEVFLVIEKSTKKKMACKMCNLGMNHHEIQKNVKAVKTEVTALSSVKHKYIVEFFNVEEDHNTLLLFLEYMEGGTIDDLLRDKGRMQESLVRQFTWQLLTAIKFLHEHGIIHKDVKGANILLDGPQKNIKVADFGISKIMNDLKTSTGGLKTDNIMCTIYWTSPELLSKKPYHRNTDIWSVGCTVVEMLTTKPPLLNEPDMDIPSAMFRIVNHQVEPPTDCSSMANQFLKQCFCPKDVRPSAAKLLETDPFVKIVEQN